MSVDFRKFLLASPVVLGLVLAAATTVKAEPGQLQADLQVDPLASQPTSVSDLTGTQLKSNVLQAEEVDENGDPIPQVTSVSQLSDVQPTDWAFQALQSLVERYGCIAGYPDGTFRGNRAATRYELAAALNACLDQLSARFVTKEDLAALRALQNEFAAELANLRGQVDTLEARTAELEANQFSTTTKLNGEAVFAAVYADVDRRAVPSPGEPTEEVDGEKPIFVNRLRLNFDTSFSGKDRLRTRIQARNIPNLSSLTGTSMSRLAFDGVSTSTSFTGNVVELGRLEYRFPVTDRGTAYIEAIGGEFNDNVNTFNPFLESSGRGSITRFGRFNPIYRLSGDTGATFTYRLVNEENFKVTADVGYLAGVGPANLTPFSAGNPLDPGGLIGAPYGALAQIGIQPFNRLQFGLTYVRSENIGTSGSTGSRNAELPFEGAFRTETEISADSFGAQASFLVTPKFNIAGWVGYTRARATSGPNDGADAQILNYAATVALPDLFREGDLIGLVFGQPPKVIDTDVPSRDDRGTSYHAEAFYRVRVSDNISITPGVYAIFNPEHNNNNDTIFVGVIRTTFVF